VGQRVQPADAATDAGGHADLHALDHSAPRWAYKVMGGKVTAAYVRENNHSAY
jgi:hypothetical protein